MFGKTSFICCYSKDRGENESKRYYKKIDYRNINHPEFEERVGNYLSENEINILKELGKNNALNFYVKQFTFQKKLIILGCERIERIINFKIK
jgi:hypothetical protein